DLLADLVPEDHAVALRIRLGDDRQLLLWPRQRQLTGIARDPLHAYAGEDGHIHSNLAWQGAMDSAADPGIFPLAVLADEDPVNFAGEVVAERTRYAGQEPRRADVSVLIEPLADGEAEAPERDVVGKAWIA